MELSRRNFLRGMGVALALPHLDMFSQFASAAAPRAKRLAVLYVPNGIIMPYWTPGTEGADYKLTPILESLAPFKQQLLVMSGLDQVLADAKMAGDHARAASTFLTGVKIQKTGALRAGISMDQVAAKAIGGKTRFPSLQYGVDPAKQNGECNAGYSCVYTTTISWETEETPLSKEADPKVAFETLFAGPKKEEAMYGRLLRAERKKSILDFVMEDASRLNRKLGRGDQKKMDEYLTSVRQLEKQIFDLKNEHPAVGDEVAKRYVQLQQQYQYQTHIEQFMDLMVLAFQTDSTRIISFMLADEFSNRAYPFLGINDGHHELSHDGGKPELLQKLVKINQFHVQRLAYFLKRLSETRDGEGSLLDSTLVMYGSGLSNGNLHYHTNLPVLLAGNAGGAIKTGRHLRFPKGTPLGNLHLAILDHMGVRRETLGDSDPSLPRHMNLSA